jgi:hypothetical protein
LILKKQADELSDLAAFKIMYCESWPGFAGTATCGVLWVAGDGSKEGNGKATKCGANNDRLAGGFAGL